MHIGWRSVLNVDKVVYSLFSDTGKENKRQRDGMAIPLSSALHGKGSDDRLNENEKQRWPC